MTKQNNETTNQFEEIALKQLVSITDLRLMVKSINFFPSPKRKSVQESPLFYYREVYEVLELFHEKLQYIISDLDDTTSALFALEDKHDIEAVGIAIFELLIQEETTE